MKPLCAITGSNGYVGSCIKDQFVRQGWEVLELVRRPAGQRSAKFVLGDPLPPETLRGVSALVHCAYDFQPLKWPDVRRINVDGTATLFQAARAAGVEKIVCISTISAYQGCRSLYGKAKLEMEEIARQHGALSIRPGLVYGEGPGGMFGKLTAQIKKSSIVPMIGDGSQIQYLVHQADLSAFVERYASGKTPPLPPVLTAAHPDPWPFRKLLESIASALHKKVAFVPLPWRFVWLGLKGAETCGLRLNFRSDSLVSLMYQNPRPDFSPNAAAGLDCRPFKLPQI